MLIKRLSSSGPLDELAERVEAAYVTDFVAPLGVSWQKQVDTSTELAHHGSDLAISILPAIHCEAH